MAWLKGCITPPLLDHGNDRDGGELSQFLLLDVSLI